MSNFAPYSNYGYISLIKEATEGTAVKPTNYLRIISDTLLPSFNIAPVQEVAGDRERNIRSLKGQIEMAGDIVFNVESKMIGHFLRGMFGVPTTQTLTAGVAFRHIFTVTDTPKTYTIDAKVANSPWVHRFYGTKINQLSIETADNKIQCTASLMPRKAFINAFVTTAVNSGTTLTVDQTSGLTTSDTILVIDKADGFTTVKELTITSIDSETQLTVSTINVQLDVNDIVVIKASTASYTQDPVFALLGGTEISVGDDIDNLTAKDKENFSLSYQNEVEAKYASGHDEVSRFPADILTKGYSGTGNLSRFYDSELNIAKLRQNVKFALRVMLEGETAIEANVAVKASSQFGTGTGFSVTATTAGKAGNDISVTMVIASVDTLSASITGNNVLISLASTTASKNTGTLIAAAVNALTGVDSAAVSTGAEQFTTAISSVNLGFNSTGTNVAGRDASEKPYLQFDNADVRTDPYFVNNTEDAIVMEEIPLTFYKDIESGTYAKQWSTRVFLVNNVSAY